MKKLLIIALLFWSCEGFGVFEHKHDGVCGAIWSTVKCYTDWNQKECLQYSDNNEYKVTQWYTDIDCEEFCELFEEGVCSIY